MTPDNHSAPAPALSSSPTEDDQLIKDLAFDEIEPSTFVLIQTANSVYELEVIDPAERRVGIKGGLFREQTVEGFYDWSRSHLRVGTSARFFVQTQSEGMLRLITSKIKRLSIKQ